MLRVTSAIALSMLIQASAETLPPSPAAPACTGDIVTVRRIEVKPPATVDTYLRNMDVHRAWYRAHGFMTNEIFGSRIVVTDSATGRTGYSTTELIAFHIRPPYGPNTTTVHDPAWIAFHKTYDEISTIRDQYQICMPKDHGG
ncbi:MAG TPA: hypothetical protein VN859_03345 [Steroidobacteraceae bacterium]|nr:hypothetical protein [Steroidobacteraceae bacterium]